MALSGLKALKVLNDLNAVKLALPSTAKLRIETFKMKKKTIFNV
jgi:glucokinase